MRNINELKILFDSNSIHKRIKELAQEINSVYPNDEVLNIICVLRGAVMFFTELSKYLKMPVNMEFVSLSSYGCAKHSSGKVSALNLALPVFEKQNVLIVEDIIDTGLTLDFLIKFIQHNCKAKSIELAVLLDKSCSRKNGLKPDFSAYEIDDKFVVGFGLDYEGLYRNLDYVGYFET